MNSLVRPAAVLVALLLPLPASSQTFAPGFVDPDPLLRAAADFYGADGVQCIQIATPPGVSLNQAAVVGQGQHQRNEWPRHAPLRDYVRTFNFATRTQIEQFAREPGLNPQGWRYGTGWVGGRASQQNERQTFVVSGEHAWYYDGEPGSVEAIPMPDMAAVWQLDMWMNPIGFLRAAELPGANPRAVWRWELRESGRDGALTGSTRPGGQAKTHLVMIDLPHIGEGYYLSATIDSENRFLRLFAVVPDPVWGDMVWEHEHSFNHSVVDGVTFPIGWHHHEVWDDERGWENLSGGHNAFGGNIGVFRPRECGETSNVEVPVHVAEATARVAAVPFSHEVRVEVQELADGVWLMGGGTHNSVAVEFEGFVAVVEAPLNQERSLAVVEEVTRLAPGKPVRYVVNTHDHYDHLGGLRAYHHIGATIVTHHQNRYFYHDEVINRNRWHLAPDLLSLDPQTEIREGYVYELVQENYWIVDGDRVLHITYVQPTSAHAEGMLMAYLPNERIAIQADLFSTHEPPPAQPTADARSLYRHAREFWDWEIDTLVPIHGPPIPWAEFERYIQSAGSSPTP
jgi:glyoxylase-like metal-dependent hydrolase (beta-lactamase superfamily II)